MPDAYFVHETAQVDPPVDIGEQTSIWHFCHIMPGARIGTGCNIGQNVYVDRDVQIGNGCKIQNNVSVYKGVTLEDDVFCGPSMVFTNVINPRAFIERKSEFRQTRVRRGATLGANCTIVCGWNVGEYAMIGAGAVVTDDVPATDWSSACRDVESAGSVAAASAYPTCSETSCPSCDMRYRIEDERVTAIW